MASDSDSASAWETETVMERPSAMGMALGLAQGEEKR
jgi:hypothetical protein